MVTKRSAPSAPSDFVPLALSGSLECLPLPHELLDILSVSHSTEWSPILSTPYSHSKETFENVLSEITLHPEFSSSTILRADILEDCTDPSGVPALEGFKMERRIRRRLLPKRPFDWAMEQDCVWFSREESFECALLLLPDFARLREQGHDALPYYHPQVSAIAFRFLAGAEDGPATLRLDFLPLGGETIVSPLGEGDKLWRVALSLAKQVSINSRGEDKSYIKRVHHDLLAGREEVQDLYRQLKQRYNADVCDDARITFRWMMRDWTESTDPQKHLWEDCAIAAWLIVVWRGMYGQEYDPEHLKAGPPGGFVDVGCGNGLLVYILACEGYKGYGIDLRARKSWEKYAHKADLRTTTLHPPEIVQQETSFFPSESFLIGNHADELTPWIPLLAAVTPRSAFLNIPCCAHTLTARFTHASYTLPHDLLDELPSNGLPEPPLPATQRRLLAPFYAPTPDSSLHGGRSFAYQLYLVEMTLRAGFVPERECLRMPSTKNIGFLGRRRVWEHVDLEQEEVQRLSERTREEVSRLVQEARGGWVARTPEGKAGEH